jgi:hypothetical protein
MRSTALTVHQHLLVCLPDERPLAFLNDVLTTAGFCVTSTSNLVQVEEALRLGGYCAVVTVASMKGPIRALSDLPLINMRPFSRGWMKPGSQARGENFEAAALLRRLRFITESRASGSDRYTP